YESREAQIEMALKVSGCYNDGSFLLAEAGTGTGKTIAYLLPAALMSYQGGSGVVISTHTINLQDQIMNKDIPDINKLFNNNLRSVLVKGRNHYLCYRKWENAYNDNEMENPAFMAMLLPWVVETEDGDGDVLNLNSYEKREWQNFSANSENCARSHCPYFRNKCFVHRVRKRAEQANLIIINHSLLLTDSMMENGILPHCDYLIIDEAHHLDKVAEDNLGFSFSFFDHILIMGDSKKLLLRLLRMAASPGIFTKEDELAEMKERQDILDNLLAKFDDNSIKGDMMFNGLKTGFSFFHEAKNPLSRTWRLDKKTRFDHKWQETETLISNYHIWVNELLVNFKKIKNMFYDDLSDESNEKDNYQLSALIIKLTSCRDALYYFIHSESEDMVAWLEQGNERVMYPIMRLAPIKVNELLAENLFADKKTIVFVSATLSVNDKFQYFKTNCGLNLINKHCEELLLTSPFDYEHMCLLVAAKDVPNVGEVSEYEYLDSISEAIIKMTLASKGRALVLFTSHVHLREVFRRIEKPLADQGIEVLGHDISGNRNSLLTKIRAKKNTVILGANSFWEGIDISGENLSLLIIVKLPFWPPDMPIMAAKMEKMKEEGKNDFSELSLPQAIIRFKQGFGRLLRNEGDRGIVCVLDRRIYEKRYGAQFINSLPIKKLRCGTIQEITNTIIKKL
ncbi:MAG: helicase C-terminal domain-containing protein, partial [Clostridiales bacterium]